MDLSQKKRYKGEIKNGQCYTMGTRGGKRKSWAIVSNVTKKIGISSYFCTIYSIWWSDM